MFATARLEVVRAKSAAVDIDAYSNSKIRADILSVSTAVSASGSLAEAYGVGLSGAVNAIGANDMPSRSALGWRKSMFIRMER